MRFKKPAAIALSVILALALSPGLAFAASPASASVDLTAGAVAQSEPTLTAQAKKKVVYVVVKRTDTFHYGSGADQYTSSVYNFSYNKNGLLAKRSNPNGSPTKWTYKGSTISKITTSNATAKFKIKNGKRVSGTCISTGGYYDKAVETYNYSGGNMTECTSTKYSTRSDGEQYKDAKTVTIAYNKKGLPVKRTWAAGTYESTESYKYDSHGNLSKRISGNSTTTFKNSYNKQSLLKKTTVGEWDYTVEYKKIKVSSSLAKVIKRQQWTIVNPNFSFYLYGIDMP